MGELNDVAATNQRRLAEAARVEHSLRAQWEAGGGRAPTPGPTAQFTA